MDIRKDPNYHKTSTHLRWTDRGVDVLCAFNHLVDSYDHRTLRLLSGGIPGTVECGGRLPDDALAMFHESGMAA